MPPPILLGDALELLKRHDWPGNVRELRNVMRRLAVLTPGATINLSDVALALGNDANTDQETESLPNAVTRCMREYINHLGYAKAIDMHQHLLEQVEPPLLMLALEQCHGNQLKVSDMLGLNRNTVRKLLRKYNIDPNYFKGP
jgi:two-component system nitrogen regulation response regulator GlnG